jgi:hypothetical protein
METESHGWGGTEEKGPGGAASGRGACEAACGDARRRWRAKWYGEGPMPCGSATTPRSIAAAEKGQAVWPGTGARRSATRSAGGRGGGGEPEPSSATSFRSVPEGPGRSKTEVPAESRGDRYWRSRAY